MTTQHTQGRLLAGVSLHEGREVFSAVSRENTRKIVAMTGYCGAADEIESIANTRRLGDRARAAIAKVEGGAA